MFSIEVDRRQLIRPQLVTRLLPALNTPIDCLLANSSVSISQHGQQNGFRVRPVTISFDYRTDNALDRKRQIT